MGSVGARELGSSDRAAQGRSVSLFPGDPISHLIQGIKGAVRQPMCAGGEPLVPVLLGNTGWSAPPGFTGRLPLSAQRLLSCTLPARKTTCVVRCAVQTLRATCLKGWTVAGLIPLSLSLRTVQTFIPTYLGKTLEVSMGARSRRS